MLAVAGSVYTVLNVSKENNANSETSTSNASSNSSSASSQTSSLTSGHVVGLPLLSFQTLINSTDSEYGYFSWQGVFPPGSSQVCNYYSQCYERCGVDLMSICVTTYSTNAMCSPSCSSILVLKTQSNSSLSVDMDTYLQLTDTTIQRPVYSSLAKVLNESSDNGNYFSLVVQNATMPSRIPLSFGVRAGDNIVLSVYRYTGGLAVITCAQLASPLGQSCVGNAYYSSQYAQLGALPQLKVSPSLLPSGGTVVVTGAIGITEGASRQEMASLPVYTSMNTSMDAISAQPFTVSNVKPSLPISRLAFQRNNSYFSNSISSINVTITLTAPQGDFLGPLVLNMTGTYPIPITGITVNNTDLDADLMHSPVQGSQLTFSCSGYPINNPQYPSNALGFVNVVNIAPGTNLTSLSLTYGGATYSSPVAGCSASEFGFLIIVTALPGMENYGESYSGTITLSDGIIPFNGFFE
jgi:hypothetical protein